MALLVVASLIPAKWQLLRTGLDWRSDHFFGFFVATSVVCFAWPRPLYELEDLSQGAIGRPKIKVAFSIGPCANWQGH